jgi:hypothetical protein
MPRTAEKQRKMFEETLETADATKHEGGNSTLGTHSARKTSRQAAQDLGSINPASTNMGRTAQAQVGEALIYAGQGFTDPAPDMHKPELDAEEYGEPARLSAENQPGRTSSSTVILNGNRNTVTTVPTRLGNIVTPTHDFEGRR